MSAPHELTLKEPRLAVEWHGADSSDGETWLVVWDASPNSRPRTFQASGPEWSEHLKPPFKSLVLKRFHQAARASTVRVLKSVFGITVATLVAIMAIAFVTGALQLRLVVSDSMAGTFERGALLAVVSPQFAPVEKGSIVVFHYYNEDRSELIGDFSHRVIGGNEKIGWETKGDANDTADLSVVLRQDIVGTVIGWVPSVGFILQPTNVLIFLLLIMLVGILRSELSELLASRRKN